MTASREVQESMFPDLVPARPQGWIMPSVFTGTNKAKPFTYKVIES